MSKFVLNPIFTILALAGVFFSIVLEIDWERLRIVSNLDLFEVNRISDSVYACIRLLFANFLMLRMSHLCAYNSTT